MYKIRKIKFENHPILKNLELNFCGQDGKAVDTVIFAGENGAGKSTVIESLYGVASHKVGFQGEVEFEKDDQIITIKYYLKMLDNGERIICASDGLGMDSYVGGTDVKYRYPFSGVFSDVDINFHANDVSTVTSLSLDSTNDSRRSNTNLPQEINQLLIDIQALDDSELAGAYHEAKIAGKSTDKLEYKQRMPRFTNAFNRMFDTLTYSKVINQDRKKVILFQKHGVDIPVNALSSGEKQVVYRGCFLLKDVDALNGAFVFIDEPEISLHPRWQEKIMDYYKGIFTDERGVQTSQIFAATHSPFIIHNNNRRNDKVIILSRNMDGDIIIEDKPEYFKCNSVEAVEDAFSIPSFAAEQPTVYLEGRTDEKYYNKALEVFGYEVPFKFKWIGYIDDRGQEVNTGEKSLDNAYQFLVSRNLPIKNVCLKDCDTSRKTTRKNNVTILSVPQFDNAKGIVKGVENALVLDEVSADDMEEFYPKKNSVGDYGEKKEIETFAKVEFCEFICGMGNEKLTRIFAHLKEVIDKLIKIFE